ncbi:TPA: DUF1367 family protein [Photobacterium damselae]
MTQVSLVKTQSGGLFPLTESDKAVLDQKRIGTVLECSVKMLRNPRFHRKFFALLNLGFDYWQPLGGAISPSERHMVDNFTNFLSAYGASKKSLENAAQAFLEQQALQRSDIQIEKSFEAYRKWVISEAGFFNLVTLPDGGTLKEARSIRFAKMDESEFSELYGAVFQVLWTHILRNTFQDEQDAETAVNRLLGYV